MENVSSRSSISESSSSFFGGWAEGTVFTFTGVKKNNKTAGYGDSNPRKTMRKGSEVKESGSGCNVGLGANSQLIYILEGLKQQPEEHPQTPGESASSNSKEQAQGGSLQGGGLSHRDPPNGDLQNVAVRENGGLHSLAVCKQSSSATQASEGDGLAKKDGLPDAERVYDDNSVSTDSAPFTQADAPLARSFISFKDLVNAVRATKGGSALRNVSSDDDRRREAAVCSSPKRKVRSTKGEEAEKEKAERRLLLEGKLVKVDGGGVCVMSDKMQEAMIISDKDAVPDSARTRAGSCSPRLHSSSTSSRGEKYSRPQTAGSCRSASYEGSYANICSKRGPVTKQVSEVVRSHLKNKQRHNSGNNKRGTTYQSLFGKKAIEDIPQPAMGLQPQSHISFKKKVRIGKPLFNERRDEAPEPAEMKPEKKKPVRGGRKEPEVCRKGSESPVRRSRTPKDAQSYSNTFASVPLSQQELESSSDDGSVVGYDGNRHGKALRRCLDVKMKVPPEDMFPEMNYEVQKEPEVQQRAEDLFPELKYQLEQVVEVLPCDAGQQTDETGQSEVKTDSISDSKPDNKSDENSKPDSKTTESETEDTIKRSMEHETNWVPLTNGTGKLLPGNGNGKGGGDGTTSTSDCTQKEEQYGTFSSVPQPSTPRRDWRVTDRTEVPPEYVHYDNRSSSFSRPVMTPERRPVVTPLLHRYPSRMHTAPWYYGMSPYQESQCNHLIDSGEAMAVSNFLPCTSPSALHWLTEEEAEIILRIRLTVGKDRTQKSSGQLSEMKLATLNPFNSRPASVSGQECSRTQVLPSNGYAKPPPPPPQPAAPVAPPASTALIDPHSQDVQGARARSAAMKIQNCWERYKTHKSQKNSSSASPQLTAAIKIQKFWRQYVSRPEPPNDLPTDLKRLYHIVRKRNITKFLVPPTYERFEKLVARIQAATEGARVRRRLTSRRVRSMVNEIKEICLFLDGASKESPPETSSRLLSQLSNQLQQKRLQLDAALNCPGMAAKFLLKRCPATPIILNSS